MLSNCSHVKSMKLTLSSMFLFVNKYYLYLIQVNPYPPVSSFRVTMPQVVLSLIKEIEKQVFEKTFTEIWTADLLNSMSSRVDVLDHSATLPPQTSTANNYSTWNVRCIGNESTSVIEKCATEIQSFFDVRRNWSSLQDSAHLL